MGSPISGFIVVAVLQRLETLVFQHHKPKFWARYVDDTFVVIDRDQLLTFKERLNAVFPDIQFTMEEEENNQLAFLDAHVCRKDCAYAKGTKGLTARTANLGGRFRAVTVDNASRLLRTGTSSPPAKRTTSCTVPTNSHASSSSSLCTVSSSCCNSNPPQDPYCHQLLGTTPASSTLPRQPAPALPLHRRLVATLPCASSATVAPPAASTHTSNDAHHQGVLAPTTTTGEGVDERLLDRSERSALTTGTLRRPAPPPPTHSTMSNRHSPTPPLPPPSISSTPSPPPPPPPPPSALPTHLSSTSSSPLIARTTTSTTTTFVGRSRAGEAVSETAVQHYSRSAANGGLETASLDFTDPVPPSFLVTSFKPSHSVTQPEERNSSFSRHRLGTPDDSSVLSQIPEEDGDSTSVYGGGGTGTGGVGEFDSSTLESKHRDPAADAAAADAAAAVPMANPTPQPPPPTHSSPGGSSMSATSTTLPLSSSQPTASSRTRSSSPLLSSSFAGSSSDGAEEEEEEDESGGLLDSISESGTAPVSASFPNNAESTVYAFLKHYRRKSSLQKYLRRPDHKAESLVCMERIKAASERSHKLGRRRYVRSKMRPDVIVMKPPKRKPHTAPSPTHPARQDEAAATERPSAAAVPQQAALVRFWSTTEVLSAASEQQSLAGGSSSTPVQLSDQVTSFVYPS
ncbi:hypothetical protein SprV_0902790700 [Sparganum proliferum]